MSLCSRRNSFCSFAEDWSQIRVCVKVWWKLMIVQSRPKCVWTSIVFRKPGGLRTEAEEEPESCWSNPENKCYTFKWFCGLPLRYTRTEMNARKVQASGRLNDRMNNDFIYLLIMSPESPINFDLHCRPFHLSTEFSRSSDLLHSNIISTPTRRASDGWKRRKSERPWQSSVHEPTRFSLGFFLPVLSMTSSKKKIWNCLQLISRVFQSFNKISSTHDGISKATGSSRKGRKKDFWMFKSISSWR